MPEWLIESIKEFLRVIMLAVVPVVIAGIEGGSVDWKIIWTVGAVAGLKFIDSALHEWNKDKPKKDQNSGLLGERGITGF